MNSFLVFVMIRIYYLVGTSTFLGVDELTATHTSLLTAFCLFVSYVFLFVQVCLVPCPLLCMTFINRSNPRFLQVIHKLVLSLAISLLSALRGKYQRLFIYVGLFYFCFFFLLLVQLIVMCNNLYRKKKKKGVKCT